IVGERLAEVRLGFLVAAAEETRHLVVPPAQGAIGGTLKERGVEAQHGLEFVLYGAAISQTLAQSERLGQRAHARRDPEVSFGFVRSDRDGRASDCDAGFEYGLATRFCRVAAEPVARSGQLPRGLEVFR